MSDAQAVIILIDTSETTINGDFYPNRLDAEKIATNRLSQYLSRSSAKTQIAIGSIGSRSFGIQSSLTTKYIKTSQAVAQAKRGGHAELEHGIRCAFLALRHRNPEITTRRVIAFIGSPHTLDEKSADKLAADANREGVSVDIIAFGDDVNDLDVLEGFTKKIQSQSYFVHAEAGTVILSDIVLSSPIGPGEGSSQAVMDPNAEEDPDVALAIRQSLESANVGNEDDELQAALRESLEGIDDPEMRNAMRQSLLEQGPPPPPRMIKASELEEAEQKQEEQQQQQTPQNQDGDDEIDMDDPELQEALRLSMQENLNEEEQKPQENQQETEQKPQEQQQQQEEFDDIDMNDPELQAALKESVEINQTNTEIQKALEDPDQLNDILSSLPGVDPNSDIFKKKDDKDKDKK